MKYIAVSNALICNQLLTPADRKVALALLSYRWENRRLTKSLRWIADRANVCVSTVRSALDRLETIGFLSRQKNCRYAHELGCVVYKATTYTLHTTAGDKYTLLPYPTVRSMLAADMTPAAFVTMLLLAMKQGQNHDHAWPSLRAGAREAGLAKSTVCRVISALVRKLFLIRLRGKSAIGSFFCNSYYVIVNVARKPLRSSCHHNQHTTPDNTSQALSPAGGGPIFSKPPINNITKAIFMSERTPNTYYVPSTVNRRRRDCVRDRSALLRLLSAACRAFCRLKRKIGKIFSLRKKGQQGEAQPPPIR